MKRILVTGGAGFIGSHTCLELLDKGYEVHVVDSFVNSFPCVIDKVSSIISKKERNFEKNFYFYKGDIRDKNFLREIFNKLDKKGKSFDAVIHFAGLKAVKESIMQPLKYWNNNFCSTLILLEVMKDYKCNTFIFSSSATIYGFTKNYTIKENNQISPINPYGNTKATIEQLLNDLYNSNPSIWKIANLRYFNPIGAHPSGLLGEMPTDIPNNIFPIINKVASKKLKKLSIFGNDWDTPDGTCLRDYIHVMDLVDGHILALEKLLFEDSKILNLNLGTGKGTSVLELVKTFEKVNNVEIPYLFTKKREGDSSKSIADNSLAYNVLSWKPKRSLEEMCKDGWNWYKTYSELI
ncbi:MAG: UDP-glucose 4-epimerase GalE [Pelagibacteraceae bacterium TMED124]|nr:MAG: UDP-glucose 4-epimerase GalE [Pelagibacteraceae bacterium TMED124]